MISPLPPQYRDAVRLEQMLGDPAEAANLLSFRQAVAWDEQEQFPEPAVHRLLALGLHHVYVPTSLGGRFESCEQFIALGRTLARRNMTVTVTFSTMLWTVLAWLGGDEEQQRRIATAILEAGEFPCLAYSEELHGADLLANETTARLDAQGRYRVNGRKWPINRATRSEWVVLLARTATAPHLHNHTLFIFDKARLDPKGFQHLPAQKTHGLRGCDISGIAFADCALPANARIGREGHGIELALKGFQITRTFCTALSLGVGDSALRLVADFAWRRQLYGRRVTELPHARDTLANAHLSLLMGECTSMLAARGLHLFPEQFSHWAAIAKVQVVRLVDYATHELAAILGARSYLRDTHAAGMFQKLLRDGGIVAVFDGNNIICLDQLATLLPKLCRAGRTALNPEILHALFDLRQPLPSLAFARFRMLGHGRDSVWQSLPLLRERLRVLPPDADCHEANLAKLRLEVNKLEMAVAALEAAVRAPAKPSGGRNSSAQIGLAERYCALHTAIGCLGFWLFNRDYLRGFTARGEWLIAALVRQGEAVFRCGAMETAWADALCDKLFDQTQRSEMYSLLPWPLAEPGRAESGTSQFW